jgi:precorrin-3B synthase
MLTKGWCPGVFAPMASGDGLLVRVKPPGARVGLAAARELAAASARFGNGRIELTSRAVIQVRGLQARDVPAFAASMVSTGLADADPVVERRRAVIVSPLVGIDPSASADAPYVAAAIEDMLARDPRFARLPPKFCASVDSGGVLPLGDVGADIRVVCREVRCLVAVSGMASVGGAADVVERVARLALAFLDLSAQRSPAPRRMRSLLEEVGVPRLFGAAGLGVPVPLYPSTNPLPQGEGVGGRGSPRAPVGWISYTGGERGAFGLGLPFGTTHAASLARLADLSERFGDGTLRTSPWRAFLIPDVSARDIAKLRKASAAEGMIVDPVDPRLTISACIGRPGCTAASVDVRADAALLVTMGLRPRVHISGCAKGCAHPAAAEYTLVGEEGQYGLVRNGRAGDAPLHRGLTIEQAGAVMRGEAP